MNDKPNKVTTVLRVVVTGEFFDDDATEETLRYTVEQDLEDAGFDVDVALLKKREETTFKPHYIDEYGKHFICGVECGACHKEISSTYHYCPWCGRVVKWK